MEINYERNPNKSVMIISTLGEAKDYEERMLSENDIDCLLKYTLTVGVDSREYHYDISGKKSLKSFLAGEGINKESLSAVFKALNFAVTSIKKYLLSANNVVVGIDTIFIKTEGYNTRCYLTYLPGHSIDFNEGLFSIAEYLIRNVDHSDENAVRICYGLFEKINENDSTLETLIELLSESVEPYDEGEESYYAAEESLLEEDESKVEEFCFESYEEEIFLKEKKPSFFKRIFSPVKLKVKETDFFNDNQEDFIMDPIIDTTENTAVNHPTELLFENGDNKSYRRLVYEGRGKHDNILISHLPFRIGSKESVNDGVIHEKVISRAHAIIIKKDEDYYLEDLESKNGTYINGRILNYNTTELLVPGDRVSFANVEYRFE